MKKPLIFSIAFVILVLVGLVFATSQKTEAPRPNANSQSTQPVTNNTPKKTLRGKEVGTYQDYDAAKLDDATGQIVLFFHAPWCPQCRSIEDGIKKQGVPDGYDIFKVDYDTSQDLREKYKITIQTTFVKIDESAAEIDKYVAYYEPTFDAVKRDFLSDQPQQ